MRSERTEIPSTMSVYIQLCYTYMAKVLLIGIEKVYIVAWVKNDLYFCLYNFAYPQYITLPAMYPEF